MLIYNQTINIDPSIQDEWLVWVQKHIKDVLATGKFSSARLLKVLVASNEITYAIQFTAESRGLLNEYYIENEPVFKSESLKLFGDKMLTFATELELIAEY